MVIGGNLLICKNEHKVTRVSLYQVIEKQIDPITIRRKHRSLLDVTVKCGIRIRTLDFIAAKDNGGGGDK